MQWSMRIAVRCFGVDEVSARYWWKQHDKLFATNSMCYAFQVPNTGKLSLSANSTSGCVYQHLLCFLIITVLLFNCCSFEEVPMNFILHIKRTPIFS